MEELCCPDWAIIHVHARGCSRFSVVPAEVVIDDVPTPEVDSAAR